MFDINQKISIEKAKAMNAVVLAYIGDCVHSLFVRERLAFTSDKKSNDLNKEECKIVCATSQAKAMIEILPILTEEEEAIYKRARNAKKGSHSKSSSLGDYSKSTGYEAVIGYLYVTGQIERLNYILNYKKETQDDN